MPGAIRKSDLLLAAVLGILTIVFGLLLAPDGPWFRDSALFTMVAKDWGILHAPGSPTWGLLAGAIVTALPLSPANACLLFAVLCAAGVHGLLYLLMLRLLTSLMPELPSAQRSVVALMAPLGMLCMEDWIAQIFAAEQYGLLLFLQLILAHLVYTSITTKSLGRQCTLWCVTGLLWGLAVGNHASQMALLLPLFLAAVYPLRPAKNGLIRSLMLLFCGAIGLCIYLVIPVQVAADPLVNWYGFEGYGKLLDFLRRSDFQQRTWADVPVGFTAEWIVSYRLHTSLGIVLSILSLIGFGWLVKRVPAVAILMLAIMIPYGLGMFLAHARGNFDLDYIRFYGIGDWHLPIWLWMVVLSLFGYTILVIQFSQRFGLAFVQLMLGIPLIFQLLITAIVGLENSKTYSIGTPKFVTAHTEHLPENSIVLVSSDNVSFLLGHARWVENSHKNAWVGWPRFALLRALDEHIAAGGLPDAEFRRVYTEQNLATRRHPLQVPLPPDDVITSGTLLCDYYPVSQATLPFVSLNGFLAQIESRPVSDDEVLRRDAAWRGAFPQPEPSQDHPLQERRAWSELYERRGMYLMQRRLYRAADVEYVTALQWLPERPRVLLALAECRDFQGRQQDAAALYQTVIDLMPTLPGPRYKLGFHAGAAGDYTTALELMMEEKQLDPRNKRIEPVIEELRKLEAAK